MKIAGVASAFPNHRYEQQTVTSALKAFWGRRLDRPEMLDRLHAHTGVKHRNLVLPLDAYEGLDTFGKTNAVWIDAARDLGAAAICSAITPLGLRPSDLDALYFNTVTGVASPSIDARLVECMGMSRRIKRIPLFGLGCVGGAAGLARASEYVRAFPKHIAVLLSVEICSLTWQRDDLSVANLISCGLFGDGAAAVVIAGADRAFDGPEVVATQSSFYPGTQETMGWDISEQGFRIVLSPDVAKVVEQNLPSDVDTFLAEQGLERVDIGSWIVHTGGPKILEAIAAALKLSDSDLEPSWESLRTVGNLSSASVLVVLQDFLAHRRGEPGSYSVLAAMGPGFCSELVLLRW